MSEEEIDPDFEALVADITPDVIRVLQQESFFAELEHRIFPDGTITPNLCRHDYAVATELLVQHSHDDDDLFDIFAVMRSRGGFCDCEILLNAAPESQVRSAYWDARAIEQSEDASPA